MCELSPSSKNNEIEEKFRYITEQQPNMIFINKKGRIVYVNEACKKNMGYSEEEFFSPDFSVLSLIAPDPKSLETIKFALSEHQKGKEVPPYEYKLITKQKKIIDVIITTKLIDYDGEKAILGIVTDISDRKKTEKALEESEKRYRALFENAGDAIFVIEAEGDEPGKIVSANKAAADMHGYTVDEIIKMNIKDLDAPESQKDFNNKIKSALSGVWVKQEIFHRKKDGTIFPVEISAGLMEIDKHKYILAFDRDIALRKQMEESLRNAKFELEIQNEEFKKIDKMRDGLIRDVTHELKTPLAKQKMQMDLLKRVLEKNGIADKCSDIIQKVEASIKRHEIIIANMLDLSILESGGRKYKIESTRVDLVLKAVINDYIEMIDSNKIDLRKKLINVEINTDIEMLFHVFSNLINNAIKYRSKIHEPFLDISIEKKMENVIVKITDNGIGLREQDKPYIFELFFRASSVSEGTGVGLTISKLIVKDLGGNLTLESSGENKGSTATVTLPYNYSK